MQVGEVYDTTNAALNAAYSEVYGKFHGWAVQKIFSYSFQAAPDGSEISGVTIIHQEETPGLGGRIAEAEFLGVFPGISLDTPMEVVAPGKAADEFQIDSITGATLSTVVFVDLLNEHIAEALDVLRGGAQ